MRSNLRAMRAMTSGLVAAGAVAMAVVCGAAPVEAREPKWQKGGGLCRQLRAEGWTPSPDGPGDPATGEMRQGRTFACRVRQPLPAVTGAKPSQIEVFLLHGGGDNLTVTAQVWTAASQGTTLAILASTLERMARELEITLPGDMLANVRSGESWSDEAGGLSFDVSKTTRDSEMISSPDLKASDIPLVVFTVSVEPAP